MGDDAAVVQAARVSYGAGTRRTRDDQGLINYLMRHRHTTPFEMCELKLHMKLPIFVARQLIRTRTASVNEYSARYSVLDLCAAIADLRAHTGKPVATSEDIEIYYRWPQVLTVGDWIFPICN
mgnify:CR=1 FL=1